MASFPKSHQGSLWLNPMSTLSQSSGQEETAHRPTEAHTSAHPHLWVTVVSRLPGATETESQEGGSLEANGYNY